MYACQPGSSTALTTPGVPPMTSGGLLGPSVQGLGLFDSGLDVTQWGIAEWSIVGGALFLAMGGMKLLKGKGASAGKRRSLRLLKAKYDLARLQA